MPGADCRPFDGGVARWPRPSSGDSNWRQGPQYTNKITTKMKSNQTKTCSGHVSSYWRIRSLMFKCLCLLLTGHCRSVSVRDQLVHHVRALPPDISRCPWTRMCCVCTRVGCCMIEQVHSIVVCLRYPSMEFATLKNVADTSNNEPQEVPF